VKKEKYLSHLDDLRDAGDDVLAERRQEGGHLGLDLVHKGVDDVAAADLRHCVRSAMQTSACTLYLYQ
jgi:hypothetical protein